MVPLRTADQAGNALTLAEIYDTKPNAAEREPR